MDADPAARRQFGRVAESRQLEAVILEDSDSFEAEYLRLEPNLVVLDLTLPRSQRVSILRYLAEIRSASPIIMTTDGHSGHAESTERMASSLGLTVAAVLTRPVDPEAFEQQLDQIGAASRPDSRRSVPVTESDLAGAISRDELLLVYQPVVSLLSGEAIGVEALVRWQHPDFGLVRPDDFIPLAEESGLISPLTYWVLERAVTEMGALQIGSRAIDVSVNLSPHLLEDLELPNRVNEMLGDMNFSRDRLMFEVTESGAMEDPNRSMDILVRLCLKNIRLSIDDFGTGYSSLLQLYRLPFCEIKIDKSFVQKALTRNEALAVVKSTVSLGRNLELRVVAEGIEDEATRKFMVQLGCDLAQGFFFGAPLPAADLLAWLAAPGETGNGAGVAAPGPRAPKARA